MKIQKNFLALSLLLFPIALISMEEQPTTLGMYLAKAKKLSKKGKSVHRQQSPSLEKQLLPAAAAHIQEAQTHVFTGQEAEELEYIITAQENTKASKIKHELEQYYSVLKDQRDLMYQKAQEAYGTPDYERYMKKHNSLLHKIQRAQNKLEYNIEYERECLRDQLTYAIEHHNYTDEYNILCSLRNTYWEGSDKRLDLSARISQLNLKIKVDTLIDEIKTEQQSNALDFDGIAHLASLTASLIATCKEAPEEFAQSIAQYRSYLIRLRGMQLTLAQESHKEVLQAEIAQLLLEK